MGFGLLAIMAFVVGMVVLYRYLGRRESQGHWDKEGLGTPEHRDGSTQVQSRSRIRWLRRLVIIVVGAVVAFAGWAASVFEEEYGDGDMTVPGIIMAIGAVIIVAGLALGWRREPEPTNKDHIASR